MVVGIQILNTWVLSWFLKLEMVYWDLTISDSLFYSTGEAVVKSCTSIEQSNINEAAGNVTM